MLNVMNVQQINHSLIQPNSPIDEILPKVRKLKSEPLQFVFEFGLDSLPVEGGVIFVRGARQLGKSTWLEQNLSRSYREFGPGSSFYLNCDEIAIKGDLLEELEKLLGLFSPTSRVKRIFIDEITSIDDWERVIKLLADRGAIDEVLLITTGSKATDIRRGSERLPGRKGKLERTNFIFCPISYRNFLNVAQSAFGQDLLLAYILTGGSPIAANELYKTGSIPEYIIDLARDWIIGETVRSGRQRAIVLKIFEILHQNGGNPISFTRIARDIDVANNTVASGYVEQLRDLLCITPCIQADPISLKRFYRKPGKLHFVNLLAAVATSPDRLRTVESYQKLQPENQAKYIEWLVAQELWRRNNVRDKEYNGELLFYKFQDQEIDFLLEKDRGLEVKRGQASPHEFSWPRKEFPNLKLDVICTNSLKIKDITSIGLEDFLLEERAE